MKQYPRHSTPWQQTMSGKEIVFQAILDGNMLDQINIEDMAHALSYQCRYAGHVKFPYSVAQHSLIASYALEAVGGDPLEGLCHDMHEAYITDLPTPVKRVLGPAWYEFEDQFQAQIYRALDLPFSVPMSVDCKKVDYGMLAWESGGFVVDRLHDWNLPSHILDMTAEIQQIAAEKMLDKHIDPVMVNHLFLERYRELR